MPPSLKELFESSLDLTSSEQSFRQLPSARGVLLFADKHHSPIQILSATGIRQAAMAKLAETRSEEPDRKTDLRPVAAFLYYTPVSCEFHSQWLYHRLVRLLFPEKADFLISLPIPHCVCADPEDPWASFTVSSSPFKNTRAVYFGPFASRKDADFFAQFLNSAFLLCRNRSLALRGEGEKCTYRQMRLCPGHCLRKEQAVHYRQTVLQALDAASGEPEDLQKTLTMQMNTLAGKMQFEQAQLLKEQLGQIPKLKKRSYQWTRRLEDLRILHIDQIPSAFTADNLRRKSPRFTAYRITANTVEKTPNFSYSSVHRLTNRLSGPTRSRHLISADKREHLARICLFLYKSRPPGLWIDLQKTGPLETEFLRRSINERFSAPAPANHEKNKDAGQTPTSSK